MKTTLLALILFLAGLDLWAQTPPPPTAVPPAIQLQNQMRRRAATNNFPTAPMPGAGMTPSAMPSAAMTPPPAPAGAPGNTAAPAKEKEVPGFAFNYEGVDLNQVLDVYADLVGRTLIRGPLPQATIVLKTQSLLTRSEAIEALEAVLAINNVSVIPIDDKFTKVLQTDQAGGAGEMVDTNDIANLPNMGSYITRIVQLKYVKPSVMSPIISPLGRLKDINALDDNGILVIRDYTENVKRMMEMIAQVDVSVPAVYISEVIPIRYAKVDDIANALNSLGGSGGATVSIGSAPSPSPISGIAGNRNNGSSGFPGTSGTTYPPGQSGVNNPTSGLNQPRLGTQATTTTPGGAPNTFQARLQRIINQASGPAGGAQEPIQLFGQTKIIPNESSSSLLIYATREDMNAITNIIAKLDVPLAQVLIEAVIVDYTLGNTLNLGVSAAQNPKNITVGNTPVTGAGGINNGQTFLSFLTNSSGNNAFANSIPGGLSYFGNIGPTWDVALSAAQSDSHASIIQRPRIQTSQAQPAQFFVGSSVPYITGSYSYNGVQNSYSQLSVGVELDVTPFINPEGEVSMQIQQEIDAIDNPNYNSTGQPSTIKRTLNTTITVRDKDTVMLGGFIEADKSTSSSGVPFLSDIPLFGNLFKQRNDSKARKELIVLMRPTVLGTPELAAKNTLKEEQRLPDVSATYAEDVQEQNKSVAAERRKELKHPKTMSGGFFNAPMPTNPPPRQMSQPQVQNDPFFSPVAPNAPAVPADNNTFAPAP